MTPRHTDRVGPALVMAFAVLILLGLPVRASAQLGTLVSPGALSKPHAALEGLANCQKCHEPGRQVTADKCLACHQPVAERIRARRGVHRDAAAGCVTCHVEHAGVAANIRPFDTRRFDHETGSGFPLDGRHAGLAADCARCHKSRSFLTASPACASCHADPHKGTLGTTCITCHPTSRPFKDATKTFDHSTAAFPLTGAHRTAACERCHVRQTYKGLRFASCADCHKTPHRQPLGDSCAACHASDTWKTRKIEHARTGFTLRGRHEQIECAACHTKPPIQVRLKFARCADCHVDVHRGAFKQDCSACHTETRFSGAPFKHETTKFPLDGKHAALDCIRCHKNVDAAPRTPAARRSVDFTGLSTACAACHTDPHKNELGARCEPCHSSATFKVTAFTHPRMAEFYAGQHASVSCAACHIADGPRRPRRTGVPVDGWRFKNLATACSACHVDAHLGQVGTSCETCHTTATAGFKVGAFDHARAAFALTIPHAGLDCAKCHKKETATFPSGAGTAVRFKGVPTTCVGCHADPHLGQLGAKCEACHTGTTFKLPRYMHTSGAALFTGGHAALACASCHKREEAQFPAGRGTAVRYKGLGGGCAACHIDPHRGGMAPNTCESCHAPAGWKSISRAFHKVTRLPLEGRHLMVECGACHINGVLKGTPTRCYDCHWNRRQDDRYRTRLGNQCEQCHRPTSWLAVNWSHAAITGVALSPIHRALGCDACHKDGVFKGTAPACASCHQQDYQRARTPNHVAAGFPATCDLCHRPSNATWQQGQFSHTSFPLVGLHAGQACAACHKNNVYKGTPRDCYGCHRTEYQNTKNPNHAAAGFPTTCETCHQPTSSTWSASFNHTSFFALVGLHASQTCVACHKNNVYKGTPRECFPCHQTDYQSSRNPNHAAAGFPTACETCHQASSPTWSASFNHNSVFPLVGLHATQTCATCHVNNVFKGTPRDCYTCHRTDYQNTRNPNHAAAGFPTTCDSCHQASSPTWNAAFNHNSVFPLVGLHATQACATCHVNNVYRGTPRTCVGCHQTQYNASRNPNHVAAGFPTTCETCHQASSPTWSASFNHNSVFPLVGLHATQACATCHVNNVYRGTPRTCVGCHQTQYNATRNPNHVAAGFPTTCETCHQASSPTWSASFNHTSVFPLVGLHATQACATCHVNNVYRGTPRTCVGCHQTQYNASRNPNHVAAGFPTTCDTCHRATDSTWAQGTFNHTWFPITSGRHAGNPCSACHTNPSNYKAFTCLTCHDRARTDAEHRNRRGYVYDSQACYSCHPTGRGD